MGIPIQKLDGKLVIWKKFVSELTGKIGVPLYKLPILNGCIFLLTGLIRCNSSSELEVFHWTRIKIDLDTEGRMLVAMR